MNPAPTAEPPAGRAGLGELKVYEVVPAPKPALWVNRMLRPVLLAIRAEGRPIIFRPMRWSAQSAGACKKSNPDGRISFSTKAFFWGETHFVAVYIHELSHSLLEDAEPSVYHQHDASFFTLNYALLLRLDAINYLAADVNSPWVNDMSLYDLQDPPECWNDTPSPIWQPRAFAFAVALAHELFATDLSAEKLAVLICERYKAWSLAMQLEPRNTVLAHTNAAAKTKRISDARAKLVDELQLYRWLTWLMGAAFLTVVYVLIRRGVN